MELTFGQNHTTWRSTVFLSFKFFKGPVKKGYLKREMQKLFSFLDPLLYSDLIQLFHNI